MTVQRGIPRVVGGMLLAWGLAYETPVQAAPIELCPQILITTTVTCDPGDPPINAALDENFVLTVRNCSADANARALVEMVYITPASIQLADNSFFGTDERQFVFNATGQQKTCAIDRISNAGEQVIGILVTGYSTSGTSPGDRKLGTSIQLQRFETPGSVTMTTLTPDDIATLKVGLLQRNMVIPFQHPEACPPVEGVIAFGDRDIATLDNRFRSQWRGLFKGKVMCSTALGSPPLSCTSSPTIPERNATHCSTLAFDIGPESCVLLHTREASNSKFDDCCDPMAGEENQALVAMQCSRAIVTEKVTANGRHVLDPFYWSSYASDVQPSAISSDPPSAVSFDCFDFAAPNPDLDASLACSEAIDVEDADNDGVVDRCDYLVPSRTIEAGGGQTVLKRRFRNQEFNSKDLNGPSFSTFQGVTKVRVQGTDVNVTGMGDLVSLTIPLPTGLTVAAEKIEVCPDATCTNSGDSDEALIIGRHGYISVSGSDYLLPFDETSGEFVDLRPSFLESVPDIPTSGPRGVAFTKEPGNENKEVLIAAGSDVFAYDDPNGILKDLNPGISGIQGASMGNAVSQVALEPAGEFAFVLHGTNEIGSVQVRRSGLTESQRFAAFSAITSVPGIPTDLMVERAASSSATSPWEYVVYVTGSCTTCSAFPPAESCVPTGGGGSGMSAPMTGGMESSICQEIAGCEILPCDPETDPECGGGGSGGGTVTYARDVLLGVRILRPNFDAGGVLLDATNPWTVVCGSDIALSRTTGGPSLAEPLTQVGLDLNSAGTELFITNPDTDSLFILNTATNLLEPDGSGQPVQIAVGADPVDVEILNVSIDDGLGGFFNAERAYVANHGDDTMSVVDLVARNVTATKFFSLDFSPLTDLRVETMAGSEATKFLFLLSPNRQRLLPYLLVGPIGSGIHGDNPSPGDSFVVGPLSRRIALQE